MERIVFDHKSVCETLKIVDAWDRVVGIGGGMYDFDPILYPNIDELPVISAEDINYEKVFELHPDIFLSVHKAFIPGHYDDMVAKLEPEIPVVALNLGEPDTIVENFRKLGLILGQEDEAEEFIEFYEGVEADILEVTSKIPDEDKPRMFHKEGWVVEDLMTYTDDFPGASYRSELIGCINIAADLPSQGGWVMDVDPEWLIEQDPDFVICSDVLNTGIFGLGIDDASAAKAFRNENMKLDVFSGGSAVKNGNVYLISTDFRATPRFIIGLAYQAKWFHPDLLQDLDPKAIHQECLTKFMRIDYNLDEHGVFAYPEPQ